MITHTTYKSPYTSTIHPMPTPKPDHIQAYLIARAAAKRARRAAKPGASTYAKGNVR